MYAGSEANPLAGRAIFDDFQRTVFKMIRPEAPQDYEAITRINIEAFADHPFSRQTEHLIVERLRRDGALTISLVAEVDGRVVGHIAFSPVWLDEADCGWFALGPVAVARDHQRQGIGGSLVRAGLEELRRRGARGCILVGDPAYYRRFGFENDAALTMEGVPPEVLMALPFGEDRPCGAVTHHPAFSV